MSEHVSLPNCWAFTLPLASVHDCDVRNKNSGYVSGITYIHTHVLVTGSTV